MLATNRNWKATLSWSAIVYMLGLAGMASFELMIARLAPAHEIAEWAALKSSLFLCASIALLGLEHALVRNPGSARRIAILLTIQAGLVSWPAAYVANSMGLIKDPMLGAIAIWLIATTIATSALFRSRLQMIGAQVATNLWRFVAMIILAASLALGTDRNYATIIIASTMIGLALSAVVVRLSAKPRYKPNNSEDSTIAFYKIGLRFFALTFLLNTALYLDQLLLNIDGETLASAEYFRHVTFFLFPNIFLAGFLGFYIGPIIRERQNSLAGVLPKYMAASIFVAIIYSAITTATMYLLFPVFFGDSQQPNLFLVLSLACIGILRLSYAIPSAVLGILGPLPLLDRNIVIASAGLAMQVVVYFSLRWFNMPAAESVALSLAIHWLIRVSGTTHCAKLALLTIKTNNAK